MRIARFAILSALAALLIAACNAAPPPPSEAAVTLKEWAIEPQELRVKAGKVTFTVTNGGNIEHNFDVEGVGKIESLFPGETKTLEVTLEPGSKIIVICSLSGHKEAGMTGTLTVVP